MALDHGPQNEIRDQDVTLQEDLIGHDAEDLAFLQTRPGDVVLNTPKPAQRLEQFSVICIICNRMIGKFFKRMTESTERSGSGRLFTELKCIVIS